MIRVKWNRKAQHSLNNVYLFLAKDSISAAEVLENEIIALADTFGHFPNKYPVEPALGEPYRFAVWKHCKIIYRVSPNEIRIHKIFDTRQDPKKLKR